ncbi:hypothetical protein IMSAG249_01954 [Lachnospiraceae bacterium]|nr:hypothetical protein IMSAG249_01954 [Lachnospiraceae bacterium]
MFGLGKKIRGNKFRIGALIGKYQDLAWPCNRIHAHIAETCFLCQCHENISRPGNLVHPGNALRSKGHGGNSLGAPCLVDFVYPGNVGGNQRPGIDLSVCTGRRSHNDPGNPCHLCRQHIHKDAGRISRFTSGHIDSRPFNGGDLLAQDRSVIFRRKPTVVPLFFMEFRNIGRRFFHDCHKLPIRHFVGFFNFFLCNFHSIWSDGALVKL